MKWLLTAAAVTLALVAISCSGGSALSTQEISATELIERVRENASGVRLLSGKGSLWFESPQASGSAFFTIAMRRPDSLLVRLKGPFGVEVGLLFLSRDRFVVYNGMANRVFTGVPTPLSMRSVLPIDLTYDQILNAFAGSFLPETAMGNPARYGVDDNLLTLVYACGPDTCSYGIDPETHVVMEYRMTDESGQTLLEAHAGKVFKRGGVFIPSTIQIRFEEQQLSIQYSSIELNSMDPSFTYSIPSGARRIQR